MIGGGTLWREPVLVLGQSTGETRIAEVGGALYEG